MKCELCDYTHNSPQQLGRHKLKAHNIAGKNTKKEVIVSKESVNCDVCNKPYKNKLGLSMHKAKAHSIIQPVTLERKINEVQEFPAEIIAYTIGQLEAIAHRIAFENDFSAKQFTKRCSEYFSYAARR